MGENVMRLTVRNVRKLLIMTLTLVGLVIWLTAGIANAGVVDVVKGQASVFTSSTPNGRILVDYNQGSNIYNERGVRIEDETGAEVRNCDNTYGENYLVDADGWTSACVKPFTVGDTGKIVFVPYEKSKKASSDPSNCWSVPDTYVNSAVKTQSRDVDYELVFARSDQSKSFSVYLTGGGWTYDGALKVPEANRPSLICPGAIVN